MPSHTSTVTISKPVEQEFDYIARGYVENHPLWDAACVSTSKTSGGPLDAGSTGVEVRRDGGREAAYEFEVTAFEESRLMAFEAESKEAFFSSAYTFEGRGGETTVTVTPRLRMKGPG